MSGILRRRIEVIPTDFMISLLRHTWEFQPHALSMECKPLPQAESTDCTKPKSKRRTATSFLSLPQELRQLIYNEALPQSSSGYRLGCIKIFEFAKELVAQVKTIDSLRVLSQSLAEPFLLEDEIDSMIDRLSDAVQDDAQRFAKLEQACSTCQEFGPKYWSDRPLFLRSSRSFDNSGGGYFDFEELASRLRSPFSRKYYSSVIWTVARVSLKHFGQHRIWLDSLYSTEE